MHALITVCDGCGRRSPASADDTAQLKIPWRGITLDLCRGCVGRITGWKG